MANKPDQTAINTSELDQLEVPQAFVDFIESRRGEPKPALEAPIPQCQKLIFVAVPTEVDALDFAAAELGVAVQRCKDSRKRLRYFDLGVLGGDRVLGVQTSMGPLTETGSAARAVQYRAETGANAIIGLGMAFGALPRRQRIGQVLVATGILPYDTRTVRTGEDGGATVDYSDVAVYGSNPELLRRFREAAESPVWKGRVMPGLILSGGARIHCAAFRDELARECGLGKGPDLVVGGDMEGVGFLSASDPRRPSWILVKAISDWADRERDDHIDRTRPIACYRSAKFVLSALLANPAEDQDGNL